MNKIIQFIKDYLIGVILMFPGYYISLAFEDKFIRVCGGMLMVIGLVLFTATLVRIEIKKFED